MSERERKRERERERERERRERELARDTDRQTKLESESKIQSKVQELQCHVLSLHWLLSCMYESSFSHHTQSDKKLVGLAEMKTSVTFVLATGTKVAGLLWKSKQVNQATCDKRKSVQLY